MCIRASEESLSCAPSITFLPQKTADMLKDKELLKKKNKQSISSSPSSTSGSVQSETVPLSPQNENKVKSNVSPWVATVTAITANGPWRNNNIIALQS